jgi:hypothetical protein
LLNRLYFLCAAINVALFSVIHSQIDFPAFYNVGQIAISTPSLIYNLHVQQSFANYMPFYHLPHEVLLFAPLSLLPYAWAFWAWRFINLASLVLGVKLLGNFRNDLLPALAMFAVPFCLFEGQDSCILFLLLAASLHELERNELLAGALLALATFKPQIPVVIAFALLIAGRKAFAAAFFVTSALIAALSISVIGVAGVSSYLEILRVTDPNETPSKMVSIRGLIALVHDSRFLALALGLALIIAYIPTWRKLPITQVFASAVLIGSLTAFHFHAYDLVVLLIPLGVLSVKPWMRTALSLSPLFVLLTLCGAVSLFALIPLMMVFAVHSSEWRVWRYEPYDLPRTT